MVWAEWAGPGTALPEIWASVAFVSGQEEGTEDVFGLLSVMYAAVDERGPLKDAGKGVRGAGEHCTGIGEDEKLGFKWLGAIDGDWWAADSDAVTDPKAGEQLVSEVQILFGPVKGEDTVDEDWKGVGDILFDGPLYPCQ